MDTPPSQEEGTNGPLGNGLSFLFRKSSQSVNVFPGQVSVSCEQRDRLPKMELLWLPESHAFSPTPRPGTRGARPALASGFLSRRRQVTLLGCPPPNWTCPRQWHGEAGAPLKQLTAAGPRPRPISTLRFSLRRAGKKTRLLPAGGCTVGNSNVENGEMLSFLPMRVSECFPLLRRTEGAGFSGAHRAPRHPAENKYLQNRALARAPGEPNCFLLRD